MASGRNVVFVVPQFYRESYHIWVVKMRSCLNSFGLCEYVDQDKQVPTLGTNPTMAQIR